MGSVRCAAPHRRMRHHRAGRQHYSSAVIEGYSLSPTLVYFFVLPPAPPEVWRWCSPVWPSRSWTSIARALGRSTPAAIPHSSRTLILPPAMQLSSLITKRMRNSAAWSHREHTNSSGAHRCELRGIRACAATVHCHADERPRSELLDECNQRQMVKGDRWRRALRRQRELVSVQALSRCATADGRRAYLLPCYVRTHLASPIMRGCETCSRLVGSRLLFGDSPKIRRSSEPAEDGHLSAAGTHTAFRDAHHTHTRQERAKGSHRAPGSTRVVPQLCMAFLCADSSGWERMQGRALDFCAAAGGAVRD